MPLIRTLLLTLSLVGSAHAAPLQLGDGLAWSRGPLSMEVDFAQAADPEPEPTTAASVPVAELRGQRLFRVGAVGLVASAGTAALGLIVANAGQNIETTEAVLTVGTWLYWAGLAGTTGFLITTAAGAGTLSPELAALGHPVRKTGTLIVVVGASFAAVTSLAFVAVSNSVELEQPVFDLFLYGVGLGMVAVPVGVITQIALVQGALLDHQAGVAVVPSVAPGRQGVALVGRF